MRGGSGGVFGDVLVLDELSSSSCVAMLDTIELEKDRADARENNLHRGR